MEYPARHEGLGLGEPPGLAGAAQDDAVPAVADGVPDVLQCQESEVVHQPARLPGPFQPA